MSMTHADLVGIAERWLLVSKGCSFVFREIHSLAATGEIPDCLGFRASSGRSILIECKTNRRDFQSDASKVFRQHPELGVGSFRFYMAPAGIIAKEDLPPKWGLIAVNEKGQARQVAGPKGFYGHPLNDEYLFRECNISVEWQMMASALRRIHLRGDLEKIYEKAYEKDRANMATTDQAPAIAGQNGTADSWLTKEDHKRGTDLVLR